MLGERHDEYVEVWTEDGWQEGRVERIGNGVIHPTKFMLSRPSFLPHLKHKDDRGWVRRGGCETTVFVTEDMTWKLTDGRVLSPMVENRTVPCAAPIPDIFTEKYRKGTEAAKRLTSEPDTAASEILGKPTSPDFVLGVVMELTRHRPLSDDPRRRTLYLKRRDIIDWLAMYCPLGGYMMTTKQPPKIKLDPANPEIGWKHSGPAMPPTSMDVYHVTGVPSGMMTLGNGIYAMSEVKHVY